MPAKQAIMPVLLDSDSVGAQFLGDIKPGKYTWFGITIDGSAAVGDDLQEAEIGRIRISEQGRDIVNVDAARMLAINRLEGGNVRLDSVAGADGEIAILIPRGYDDSNAHLVTEQDLAKCQITHAAGFTTAFSTGAGTGIIELYGLLGETSEANYILKIIELNEVIGANTTEKVKMTEENVFALYVVFNTSWDRFRILRDNEEAVNCSFLAATHFSDMLNETDSLATANTEGAGDFRSTIHAFRLANPGEIVEMLSDNVQLEISSNGSATAIVVQFSADFAPSKLRQTKVETASITERKLARKEKLGRTRPIQAVRVMNQ